MTSYDANGAPVETEAVRRFWKQTGQVPVEVGEHPDGDFVLWSDHLAAVQRLSEQLAAAKRDYAIMDETDKAYIKTAHAELASLRTQLSAATAALEAAQKDAERFQWWFIKRHRLYMFGASDRHDPDAAIDAAQREGGGE